MGRIWELCSYCGKEMGYKDGEGVTGVSHSICDQCFSKSEAGFLFSEEVKYQKSPKVWMEVLEQLLFVELK